MSSRSRKGNIQSAEISSRRATYRVMDQSTVKGGAVIQHRIVGGKNEYEILGVVRYQDSQSKSTSYLRKGDKILEVNNTRVEHLEPDALLECLSETTTHLVIHRPPTEADYKKPIEDSESTYKPYSKEKRVFTFDLQMEKIDGASSENINKSSNENNSTEHIQQCEEAEEKEDDDEMANILVLKLSETVICIMKGRGHTPGSICKVCHRIDCDLHDVMVQSSSTIRLVARGAASLEQILSIAMTHDKMLVRNISHKFLTAVEEKPKLMTLNSRTLRDACITIFYYKTIDLTEHPKGLPVILKFSDTNCYLACHEDGNSIVLKVEDYSTNDLKSIRQGDNSWRFVFYMKKTLDGTCKFESAKYSSWFIKSELENDVALKCGQYISSPGSSFVFIVSRSPL